MKTKKMSQILLVNALLASPVFASEERVENRYQFAGDVKAMELCAAALRSKTFLVAEAKRLHLTRKALKDVTCNNQSLADFANTNKFIRGSKVIASAR